MTELINISKVKMNPNNPRIIKDEKFNKLVKSIKDFPQMMEIRQIVVNSDMVVLGGNMRLKACKEIGLKEIPIIKAEELTEDQQREFIIKDNVGFGEWEWEMLANEWDNEVLQSWGVDVLGYDINHEEFGDEFSLQDGEKEPFQQMTFTFADEQAQTVKDRLCEVKETDGFKYCETFGNENSNGNALYYILTEWARQKK